MLTTLFAALHLETVTYDEAAYSIDAFSEMYLTN